MRWKPYTEYMFSVARDQAQASKEAEALISVVRVRRILMIQKVLIRTGSRPTASVILGQEH